MSGVHDVLRTACVALLFVSCSSHTTLVLHNSAGPQPTTRQAQPRGGVGGGHVPSATPAPSPGVEELVRGVDYAPFPASGVGNLTRAMLFKLDLFGCNEGLNLFVRRVEQAMPRTRGRRIGLVRRGLCNFQEKLDFAQSLHLDALLIYNQGDTAGRTGLLRGAYITNSHGLPVFFLTLEAGLRLRAHHGEVTLTSTVERDTSTAAAKHITVHSPSDESMNATKLILTQDRLRRSHTEDAGLAFYEAALAGECAVAEALRTLPGVDVNKAGYDAQRKETALHAAARRGHPDCVRLLVLLGADLEAIDTSGRQQTALSAAVLAEMHTTAAVLLELGANATHVDVWGYDPLWYAVRQNAAMVDLLLQWGADPNRLQRSHAADAESAFHLALKLGRYDEVRTMLRWGADLTKPTKAGKTPQEMAAELLEKMVSQTPSASESDSSGGTSAAASASASATEQGSGDQEGGKKTLAGHHAVLVSGAVYFGHNRGPFHGRWWRGLFRWFLVGLLLLVPGVRDCFPESLWFALGLNTAVTIGLNRNGVILVTLLFLAYVRWWDLVPAAADGYL